MDPYSPLICLKNLTKYSRHSRKIKMWLVSGFIRCHCVGINDKNNQFIKILLNIILNYVEKIYIIPIKYPTIIETEKCVKISQMNFNINNDENNQIVGFILPNTKREIIIPLTILQFNFNYSKMFCRCLEWDQLSIYGWIDVKSKFLCDKQFVSHKEVAFVTDTADKKYIPEVSLATCDHSENDQYSNPILPFQQTLILQNCSLTSDNTIHNNNDNNNNNDNKYAVECIDNLCNHGYYLPFFTKIGIIGFYKSSINQYDENGLPLNLDFNNKMNFVNDFIIIEQNKQLLFRVNHNMGDESTKKTKANDQNNDVFSLYGCRKMEIQTKIQHCVFSVEIKWYNKHKQLLYQIKLTKMIKSKSQQNKNDCYNYIVFMQYKHCLCPINRGMTLRVGVC